MIELELLLDAIKRGMVSWDDLIPDCERRWVYFTDWDARHELVRFDPADNPEHNAYAPGWRWDSRTDTWYEWPGANDEAFRFGWCWYEVDPEHVAAVKDSVPKWDAGIGERWS